MRNIWMALIGFALIMGVAQCMPAQSTAAVPPTVARTYDDSTNNAAALNSIRARYGLPAVTPDATLVRVADGHARDMLSNGFFGHISSNGDTIVERAKAQGYPFCHIAENLADGHKTYRHVLRHWMTSPSHRSNVLHDQVTSFGLVRGTGDLWVLVLGSPGC